MYLLGSWEFSLPGTKTDRTKTSNKDRLVLDQKQTDLVTGYRAYKQTYV